MKKETIKDHPHFVSLLREALPELLKEPAGQQAMLDAVADNGDAMRATLEKMGYIVGDGATVTPRAMLAVRDEQIAAGRILGGFGGRVRESVRHMGRLYWDPYLQRERITYIDADAEIGKLTERWMMAMLQQDYRHPESGEHARELCAKINEATRAPATPLTAEEGTSGGQLVPTIVAAEIFEETTERFVLRGLVQVFTSAAPLDIPRRTSLITVTRGALATDINEEDPNILGSVKLSAERVSAIAYIEPRVAAAAVVGPVRYIISQFAEALARDDQRVIIAGDPNLREPTGINTLPTAGPSPVSDRARTATWLDTDRGTRRQSLREGLYAMTQFHRMQPSFRWIMNSDAIAVMANLNDTDQVVFRDAEGQNPERLFNKNIVETTALATAADATTILGADMQQYAWLEVPGGLTMEQTTVGGEAWVSHTIGVKVIQEVDGAPVIPPAFLQIPSVDV